MRNHSRAAVARMLLVMLALAASSTPLCAADWQVAKSSGEVWIATPNAQPASLGAEAVLRAGDKIQTGRNGRVLLVRGTEAIMIAPNSVVALPAKPTSEHTTTLLHQAGSIVLEVEKRDVNHFEVETPYLAAVVKGTRFAVTVSRRGAHVSVATGKVHVSDFKTGQSALVLTGQVAHAPSSGKGGLMLEGAGQLGPVQPGIPRKSHLERVPVPAKGLGAPRAASTAPTHLGAAASDGRVRIVAPIGLTNLDIAALTKGLARGSQSAPPPGAGAKGRGMSTVWSNDASGPGMGPGRAANENGNGNGNGGGGGNADGNANGKGAGNGKGKNK